MVFEKRNTMITKGLAVILLYIHHLFNDPSLYSGFVINFYPFSQQEVYIFSIFSKICVAIFVFLSGYGAARSDAARHPFPGSDGRVQTVQGTLAKCVSLLFDYWFVFVLAQITSFLGRSQADVYGAGPNAIVYFIIDFFGLSHLYSTPTFNPTWWYMTLAFAIFIMIPFLLDKYRTKGVLVVLLCFLLPRMLLLNLGTIFWYLPSLVMGIWCAKENILEKMKAASIVPSRLGSKAIKFILTAALLAWLYVLRNTFNGWVELWDAVIAFVVTYFCFEFLSQVPILSVSLAFIGKHSMNMFLTHTFIFCFYLKAFTYSCRHFLLILAVLLCDTLILSILIEQLKKITRFNVLKRAVITRCFPNRP